MNTNTIYTTLRKKKIKKEWIGPYEWKIQGYKRLQTQPNPELQTMLSGVSSRLRVSPLHWLHSSGKSFLVVPLGILASILSKSSVNQHFSSLAWLRHEPILDPSWWTMYRTCWLASLGCYMHPRSRKVGSIYLIYTKNSGDTVTPKRKKSGLLKWKGIDLGQEWTTDVFCKGRQNGCRERNQVHFLFYLTLAFIK